MSARRRLALAVLAALTGALALAAPSFGAYVHLYSFGREGSGPGQFGSGILGGGADKQWDDPAGIGIAPNGDVLVVDVSNNRVQRFTRAGRFLGKFGRRGRDAGFLRPRLTDRFFVPEGLAVDGAGNIFVADGGNDRVMKFNSRGRFLRRLGKTGSFPGEVVQPWGVALAGSTVFVSDQGNYEIDRFGTNGGFRGALGSFGRQPGQFVHPYGVAATPGGEVVYVADYIRNKVIAYSGRGAFLAEFGSSGRGRGQFLKPAGIARGPDGTLFVADRCNWRVQHFTADGQFIESFGEGRLASPTFIAVDRTGRVFVSDYHRVAVFGPSGSGAQARTPARAAHHNGIDIFCRGVGPNYGAPDRRAPQR
jgi:DNA-binding beta-propeller fold protein YncE